MERGGGKKEREREREKERKRIHGWKRKSSCGANLCTFNDSTVKLNGNLSQIASCEDTKWLRGWKEQWWERERERERGNRIAVSQWSLVHWCLDGIYMGALAAENWFNQMKDTKTLEMWLLSLLSPHFEPLQVIERTINQQQRLRNSTPGLMTGQKGKSLH